MRRDRTRRLRIPRRAVSSFRRSGTRGILLRPSSSAADRLTVNVITSFQRLLAGHELTVIRCWNCGASCGAASAPGTGTSPRAPAVCGQCATSALPPVAAPVQLAPHVHHLRQRSLAFGKIRARKTRCPRIPSVPGNTAFPAEPKFPARPATSGGELFDRHSD